MTELFKQRVAAFQMFLDFSAPYAVSIRAFMRDVIRRLEQGIALEEQQAKLLLTRDLNQIHSVLDGFAVSVEQSAVRLRRLLSQDDVSTAYRFSRGWADNYWRQYGTPWR